MSGARRERLRAATIAEISQTARRLLVQEGPEAVTLRAIAREMGMTAPALYRYFPSRGDLIRHLAGDLYNEVTDSLAARLAEVADQDIETRLRAVGHRFRHWSLEHPREYGLIFGTPIPQPDRPGGHDHADECGNRFGMFFMELFYELWARKPFPVTPDEGIDPGLRAQLTEYRDHMGITLPLGGILVYLQCWVLLQGAVSLEVFGHVQFALTDPEPLFALTLDDILARLGF
ncbi:TetR/AcrR family transcriptional regulator [Actinocorallia populi]|uniref:TetR/AcrR family transcriptional regulator n=1 Tax=Actinocorallia populi TaxID=2079200 RepID=UPI000D08B575|nr:TetR/AcrR family transcriptional regulator [Actinocorallia populi]